jgi:hypothetical protein
MYGNGYRTNFFTAEHARFRYGIATGAGGQTDEVQMFAEPNPEN